MTEFDQDHTSMEMIYERLRKLMRGSNLPKILTGGLKRGEITIIGVNSVSQNKCDIGSYLYRLKIIEKIELESFIEKGEGTVEELNIAKQKLAKLMEFLNNTTATTIPANLYYDDNEIGMCAFRSHDGKLDFDSFNVISPLISRSKSRLGNEFSLKLCDDPVWEIKHLLPTNAVIGSAKPLHNYKTETKQIPSEKKKKPPSKLLLKLVGQMK